jgi:hypothetical protein
MMIRSVHATDRSGPLVRMLVWFAGLIFVLQMLGATQHRHDLAHTASDCASCMLTAQPPSPPSLPVAPQLVVAAAVLHYVLAIPDVVSAARVVGFLTPPAHAPPTGSM